MNCVEEVRRRVELTSHKHRHVVPVVLPRTFARMIGTSQALQDHVVY